MVMFWQIGTLQAVGSRGRAEWGPRGCVVCLLWVCLHVLPPPTPDFYTPSPPQECGSDPCVQDVANERCHNENSPTPSDDPKRLAPDLGHAHCLLVGDNHDGGKSGSWKAFHVMSFLSFCQISSQPFILLTIWPLHLPLHLDPFYTAFSRLIQCSRRHLMNHTRTVEPRVQFCLWTA